MISMLRGEVVMVSGTEATIMVGGVGYLVHVPGNSEESIRQGEPVTLHTHLIAREDAMALYGFTSPQQKEIFTLLLNVSGVGPKTAMNILSGVEPGRFLEEVVSENIGYLSSLPGIGKKSAARIAFHLLRVDGSYAAALAERIEGIQSRVRLCSVCGAYAEDETCEACSDPRRD